MLLFITGRNEVVAKVIFFAPVCHSVHGGGGGIPEGTEADPPGPYTHPPPEADSGIRSTSGRYASFWNAFLLFVQGG